MARDILVIEDEPMVTQAVEMVCGDQGMSVMSVDSARAALDCLQTCEFRLVL